MRCLGSGMTVGADAVRARRIERDEDDVRATGLNVLFAGRASEEEEKEERRPLVIPSVARNLGVRGRQGRSLRPLAPRSLATLGMTLHQSDHIENEKGPCGPFSNQRQNRDFRTAASLT